MSQENTPTSFHWKDLYNILRQASLDTDTWESFQKEVEKKLEKTLGANNYVAYLAMFEHGSRSATEVEHSFMGNKHPRRVYQWNDPGHLPGSMARYGVNCTVFYNLEENMSQENTQTGIVELSSPGASAVRSKDTSSFTSVKFPKPFPDGSKVIVVPMTQTFNGPDTPGIRISHVTTTGFMIRLNELVGSPDGKENQRLSDGTHENETIGWAAFTV